MRRQQPPMRLRQPPSPQRSPHPRPPQRRPRRAISQSPTWSSRSRPMRARLPPS
jgi:hypothetical protein